MLARGGVNTTRTTVGEPRHIAQRRAALPGFEQFDQRHLPFAQHRHVDIRAIQRRLSGQRSMGTAQDDQRVGIVLLGDARDPYRGREVLGLGT